MWIDHHLLLQRRQALQAAGGFGLLALGDLLRADTGAAMQPHHAPKAKRVIQLFMNGGVSQMDTFDYKPELIKRHDQKVDLGLKAAATSVPGPMMKSPFPWKQHGQCGRWVTDRLPHLAKRVDSLAFLMANLGLVDLGKLVLDPFVGTGSLLLAAAQFGGLVCGGDIDFLTLHARSRPSRVGQKIRYWYWM